MPRRQLNPIVYCEVGVVFVSFTIDPRNCFRSENLEKCIFSSVLILRLLCLFFFSGELKGCQVGCGTFPTSNLLYYLMYCNSEALRVFREEWHQKNLNELLRSLDLIFFPK